MGSSDRPRKWPRYSLATALVCVLCCAGFLAGYRQGVNQGYQRWLKDKSRPAEYVAAYDVRDLLAIEPASTSNTASRLTSLSTEIETLVDPSYSLVVAPYPAGSSLVISTDLTTHRKIERLLAAKRQSD